MTSIAPDPQASGEPATPGEPAASGEPARPLRKDAERNRQRILAAASEVFAERGLDVSLDDIARHAGLGVGTVYRRFPTKDLLIEALFEDHLDTLLAMADRAANAENPWEGFVNALTEVCAMHAGNQGLREILLSSAYGQGCAERARNRITPTVEKALRRAQDAGYLRPDVRPTDVMMIEFMIGGVAHYTRHVRGAWRRYLDMVIDGLRARPGQCPLSAPALTDEEKEQAMTAWLPTRSPKAP